MKMTLPELRRKKMDCNSMVQSPLFISNFAFHSKSRSQSWRKSGEVQNLICFKLSVNVSVDGDLGCHIICCCWSTMFYQVKGQHSANTTSNQFSDHDITA